MDREAREEPEGRSGGSGDLKTARRAAPLSSLTLPWSCGSSYWLFPEFPVKLSYFLMLESAKDKNDVASWKEYIR